MHRRFLFPLAAGIVGLLAFSPVLAAQPFPAAEQGPAKATTTTAPADDSGAADPSDPDSGPADSGSSDPDPAGPDSSSTTASTGKGSSTTATTRKGGSSATTAPGSGSGSSTDCGQPDTAHSPAPQVGDDPQAHEAGEAGTVEVERLSQTELRIAKATANDGWTHQVTGPSGPRVNVRFTRSGQSPSLIRFAASMDQAGQEIHVRVTTCG